VAHGEGVGEICDLGCLGGASRAFDTNDAGHVVGTRERAPDSVVEHAVLWTAEDDRSPPAGPRTTLPRQSRERSQRGLTAIASDLLP
jgi:hypothetical protein